MRKNGLKGCGTALVTPFSRDGSVDEESLRGLVRWQLSQGVHFLVPCGSTGEAVTLTAAEHRRVVEIVVEEVAGRVPVVAGAGSNNTANAIALSREMKAAGADALLHVTPMYNKPPQRGLIKHFRSIADSVDLPIVLYNVPGRTSVNMTYDTTVALAQVPNIIAVKEASGDMTQMLRIIADRIDGFSVLSGDDIVTLPLMVAGAVGVISVVSNATPRLMSRMTERALKGDFKGARADHERLLPWMRAAFFDTNPIPAKAALTLLGRIENVLRLPLRPLEKKDINAVRSSLVSAGAL